MIKTEWRSDSNTEAPTDEVRRAREEVIFRYPSFDEHGVEVNLRRVFRPKKGEWDAVRDEYNHSQSWSHTIIKKTSPEKFGVFKGGEYRQRFEGIFTSITLKEENFRRSMIYNEEGDRRTVDLTVMPNDGIIKSLSTTYDNDEDQSCRALHLKFHTEDDVSLDLLVNPHALIPQTNFYLTHEPDKASLGKGGEKMGIPFRLGPNVVGNVSYTDNGFIDTRIQYKDSQGEVLLGSQIQIPFCVDIDLYRSISSSEDFEKWKDAASLVVPVNIETKGKVE
jgi:hypothetical protein